jgi:alcohol dehydrogenase (NADP+)
MHMQEVNASLAEQVPRISLSHGSIPAIGLGTFGSDHVRPDQMADAVLGAAEVGYRHFDCAEVYGNESELGAIFEQILGDGVAREDLWVNSKVWNNHHAYQEVIDACKRSLDNLRLDYLNLYFVHWPFRNYHPPGCDGDTRNPNSKPYDHSEFMETWEAMEWLLSEGLVRNIGTSNMTIPKLTRLLRDCSVKPACNEMEIHPHFQQPELFTFCRENGILPIGYCPLGSPGRPERDRAPGDTVDIEDPVIVRIAEAHGIHPATVCIKWAHQRGQVPIPMSTQPRNYTANLKAVTGDPLAEDEMAEISTIDRNCRLIKGQVFLWNGASGWQDLWDMNGTITV